MKQLEFNFEKDKGQIKMLCKLEREPIPITSKVKIDEFTKKAQENFDYDFDGVSKFYPFKLPEELNDLDFEILAIVGASGSGKSTFAKYFGSEEQIEWDNSKSIMSNFDNPNDAIDKLCAVGLTSIPTWCKPREVLSYGEGFRCDLARRIKNNCLIDEYTSVVDRNVAKSCSASLSKYIRKNHLKKCVFVSCHKDFIDFLCPDYVIDLDDECVYDTRDLLRQRIELQIFQRYDKQQVWNIFRKHHYLSADFNIASNLYVAYWENQIVGMISILPQPNGYCINGVRVHRLVVLPDYQGLGIGMALLNYVVDKYAKEDKIIYIRTTHYKLCKALENSKNWRKTHRSGEVSPKQNNHMNWSTSNRTPMSFESIKYKIEKKKSLVASGRQMKMDLEEINKEV